MRLRRVGRRVLLASLRTRARSPGVRADARRRPPRRVRPVSRQQRPAFVSPRRPRRSGSAVHRRQEHDSIPDAARTIAASRSTSTRISRSTRSCLARRRSPTCASSTPCSSIFRRRCNRARSMRSTSTTRARPEATARFGGISFGKDPAGRDWVTHRVRGRRRQLLVAEQGPVARRGREHGDQRRGPQRPRRRLQRRIQAARPTSATVTRGGTGRSITRSTTTTWR